MTGSKPLPQWPTYDDKSRKGDVGVALVKLAVTKGLQWVFREKSQIDLGIDGEIEVVEPDAKSHGRLVSVQIKCGSSFFRSESERGFRYRPKPQHLNYWLGYTTPVILVLVDDETEICYWQHVTIENLTVVDGINVIDVPREQVIDPSMLQELRDVANGQQEIDLARQLFRIWLVESSLFANTWNNELQIPRDFHGLDLFMPSLPSRGLTAADTVLARPKFAEAEDEKIGELLDWAVYNHRNGFCDHLMIGLISGNPSALSRDRLPAPPTTRNFDITVEFVPLLLRQDRFWPRLVELDSNGESLDDDIGFLYLNRAEERDRALNEQRRRSNRLWGTL